MKLDLPLKVRLLIDTSCFHLVYCYILILNVPIPDKKEKINLNFYFNTTFRNVQGGNG